MKGRLAAVVAGIALGSVGAASASGWWQHSSATYVCSGPSSIARCVQRGSGYSVMVTRGLVSIAYQGTPLFVCRRYDYPEDCGDLR